ncbi:MAG: hypothetical protein MMC33_004924 [Icmadophila ericetorum]|nr:hypothetical protein [Icmadophila ericetorum]
MCHSRRQYAPTTSYCGRRNNRRQGLIRTLINAAVTAQENKKQERQLLDTNYVYSPETKQRYVMAPSAPTRVERGVVEERAVTQQEQGNIGLEKSHNYVSERTGRFMSQRNASLETLPRYEDVKAE